jgi:mannose-6-phosphate isomerase-like protein (cupin superfamily)
MISRRNAVIGLLTVPGILTAVAEAAANPQESKPGAPPADQDILGPHVFEWDQMQFNKTPTGEVAQLCKQPTATLDQLEMHVSKLNPGTASHPPHRHVNEELIIIREGDCETLSDGKWIKVGPGSVVFNASNSLHCFRNVGSTVAVYHVINWSPNKEKQAAP